MRFWFFPLVIMGILLLFASSCNKEDNEQKKKGVLKFKTTNPWTAVKKSDGYLKSSNPPLNGDTTITTMTSLKVCIGDVWVSQGEVKAGNADDLEWIRLTDVTNQTLKLFEEYTFQPVDLPVGTYRSIKISFKNIFYRFTQQASDPMVHYELLETMGSSADPCDENDTSWVNPNYFSADGNHKLNDNGKFELVSQGEKIGGFTIEENKTAVVSWRLGAGVEEPCTNYLIDVNGNRTWDCGFDHLEIECPPQMEFMWDFLVEYE